jgi:malic enzyme
MKDLTKQRVVCLGAGSAGLGVALSIYHGMVYHGLRPEVIFSLVLIY